MLGCHPEVQSRNASCRLVGGRRGRVVWRRLIVRRACIWWLITTYAWLGFYRPNRSIRSDLMPTFQIGAFAARPLRAIARPKSGDHWLSERRAPSVGLRRGSTSGRAAEGQEKAAGGGPPRARTEFVRTIPAT